MLPPLRQCRSAAHAALAALAVLTLSHCSWQDSLEMGQRAVALRHHGAGLPTPLQAPVHDCYHEFGCICRGATVVQTIAVTDWQPQAVDLLPFDGFSLPAGCLEIDSASAGPSDEQNLPPPLSGRQLRALHASLVI